MNKEQIEIAKGLKKVDTGLQLNRRKFIDNMAYKAEFAPQAEISEKQEKYLYSLVYTYRGQLNDLYNKYKNHKLCQKTV